MCFFVAGDDGVEGGAPGIAGVAAGECRLSRPPRKPPGKRRKVNATAESLLEHDLEERPSATLTQRRELLARVAGVEVSDSTISRALRRMGFSRKKDRWERRSATSS